MDDTALSFIRDSSDRTLQEYELMRRNNAANLSKQVRSLVNEIVDNLVEAELARIWRDNRPKLTE